MSNLSRRWPARFLLALVVATGCSGGTKDTLRPGETPDDADGDGVAAENDCDDSNPEAWDATRDTVTVDLTRGFDTFCRYKPEHYQK